MKCCKQVAPCSECMAGIMAMPSEPKCEKCNSAFDPLDSTISIGGSAVKDFFGFLDTLNEPDTAPVQGSIGECNEIAAIADFSLPELPDLGSPASIVYDSA